MNNSTIQSLEQAISKDLAFEDLGLEEHIESEQANSDNQAQLNDYQMPLLQDELFAAEYQRVKDEVQEDTTEASDALDIELATRIRLGGPQLTDFKQKLGRNPKYAEKKQLLIDLRTCARSLQSLLGQGYLNKVQSPRAWELLLAYPKFFMYAAGAQGLELVVSRDENVAIVRSLDNSMSAELLEGESPAEEAAEELATLEDLDDGVSKKKFTRLGTLSLLALYQTYWMHFKSGNQGLCSVTVDDQFKFFGATFDLMVGDKALQSGLLKQFKQFEDLGVLRRDKKSEVATILTPFYLTPLIRHYITAKAVGDYAQMLENYGATLCSEIKETDKRSSAYEAFMNSFATN